MSTTLGSNTSEQFGSRILSLDGLSADVTLTTDQAKQRTLIFTGAPAAAIAVIFPVASQDAGMEWNLVNLTTGTFDVTVKATGQTGFILARGTTRETLYDGTDLTTPAIADRKIARRFELKWTAGQRGKPAINGDIALDENSNAAAHLASNIADPDFEVLGTNATSALCTFNVEGGITLTTANASGDQMILAGHLDTNQSAWKTVTWGTDQQTEWECQIKTGASIAAVIIWAGLKLTNTPTVATDNEQVFVRYEAGVNSGKFQVIYSIAGVDVTVDSGITVAASTVYHIAIKINASRVAKVYINGLLVATSTALADTTDLLNYIGVQAATTGGKAISVHGQAISRVFA